MYALIKLPHMKRNVFNVRYIGDGENSTCERRRLVPSDMTDLLRDIDSISLDSRSTGCGGSPPGGSNGTSPHPERRLLARLQEDVNSLSQTNRDQSQVRWLLLWWWLHSRRLKTEWKTCMIYSKHICLSKLILIFVINVDKWHFLLQQWVVDILDRLIDACFPKKRSKVPLACF